MVRQLDPNLDAVKRRKEAAAEARSEMLRRRSVSEIGWQLASMIFLVMGGRQRKPLVK